MTSAPVAGLRVDLGAWPGVVVELSADGSIEASNGRLEALLQETLIKRRFADLVDDESSGEKLRRMIAAGAGEAPAKWELVLRSVQGLLEPRAFTYLTGRAAGGGWLVEHPLDPRLERMSNEVLNLNSELVVAQRELLKKQQRLAAVLAELERSNAALDEFAQVVSHDLKAPIGSVMEYAELLSAASSRLQGDEPKYLERIGVLSRKMRAMVDGLLAYARAGRASSQAVTANVGDVLRGVLELAAPPADARIDLASDLPTIEMDRVPFEQVFRNLISNAIKYRGSEPLRIAVTARDAGTCWELTVADNGIGIPQAQQERMWRLFQTSRPREETGIGLAVVKRIVESQGGAITVESDAGEGARFHVLWPKRPSQSPRSSA